MRKSFILVPVVFMEFRIVYDLAVAPKLCWRQRHLSFCPSVHSLFPLLHFSNLERLRTDIEVIFYDDLSKQAVAYRCSVGLCQKNEKKHAALNALLINEWILPGALFVVSFWWISFGVDTVIYDVMCQRLTAAAEAKCLCCCADRLAVRPTQASALKVNESSQLEAMISEVVQTCL